MYLFLDYVLYDVEMMMLMLFFSSEMIESQLQILAMIVLFYRDFSLRHDIRAACLCQLL